jgi:hypothetical protein
MKTVDSSGVVVNEFDRVNPSESGKGGGGFWGGEDFWEVGVAVSFPPGPGVSGACYYVGGDLWP